MVVDARDVPENGGGNIMKNSTAYQIAIMCVVNSSALNDDMKFDVLEALYKERENTLIMEKIKDKEASVQAALTEVMK